MGNSFMTYNKCGGLYCIISLCGHITVVRKYPKMLIIGAPKTMNFPFVPNGKFMVLGVPILKHIKVVPAIRGHSH